MACFVGSGVVPCAPGGNAAARCVTGPTPTRIDAVGPRPPYRRCDFRSGKSMVGRLRTSAPLMNAAPTTDKETSSKTASSSAGENYLYESDEWCVKAFRELHRNCPEECDVMIDSSAISGTLPTDLMGCLYSNGAGKYERSNLELKHPFEGDGMVCAVSFYEDGQVWFRNRFVRTRWFQREEKINKYVFKNAFKTLKPGGWFANLFITRLKNPANVNVVHWAGKLLALYDQSFPFLLDTHSLATLGPSRLGNVLKAEDEGGRGFTAHPRMDPRKRRLVGLCFNNGSGLSSKARTVDVCEFDEEFKKVNQTQFTTKNMAFLHDTALSDKYAIVLDAPLKFEPVDFILGKKAPAECLKFDPTLPCDLILVPRDGSKPVVVPLPKAVFCFHFANAFEDDETGETVVDMICTDRLLLGVEARPRNSIYDVDWRTEVTKSSLQRVRISRDGQVVSMEPLCDGHVEMPKTHPAFQGRPYRFVYTTVHVSSVKAAGAELGPQSTAIQKVDLKSGTVSVYSGDREEFFSEPEFVPRQSTAGDEDDGYVLSIITNPIKKTSKLGIFDAKRFGDGPMCTIALPTFMPFRLHGSFAQEPIRRQDMKRKTSTHEIFAGKGWNEVKSEFSSFGTNFLD